MEKGEVKKYELYPQLRETGGRATYTGVYGDEMRNAKYKDAYGMYGLYFSYASAMNSQSVAYFNDNTDAIAKTPAARWGEPQDLMGPAVFLASDASNFVNGHVLYVDGGILAYIGKQPE